MDKAALLARRGGTEEVPIGDGSVRVRALTLDEVEDARTAAGGGDKPSQKPDPTALKYELISRSMVAPEMTPDEVAEWLGGAPAGDAMSMMTVVSRLSGIDEGAQKSRVSGVRGKRRR
jgi:hypothetical protein